MKTNNMNIDKINKMKYELIDDLSDSQVELLVESMIVDKYTMKRDELISNESGLVDVFQYLIDTGKIVHVLNGVYGAYNKLLFDLNFKGFKYDVSSNGKYNGLKGLAKAYDDSKELYQENQQLRRELAKAMKTIDNFNMPNDEVFERDLKLLKEIVYDKE